MEKKWPISFSFVSSLGPLRRGPSVCAEGAILFLMGQKGDQNFLRVKMGPKGYQHFPPRQKGAEFLLVSFFLGLFAPSLVSFVFSGPFGKGAVCLWGGASFFFDGPKGDRNFLRVKSGPKGYQHFPRRQKGAEFFVSFQ